MRRVRGAAMTLMVGRGGRHRARGVRTWVLVVGAVVLLAVGVGGGVLVGLASPAQGPAATAAGTPTPPVALSAPPPTVPLPSRVVGAPAPADGPVTVAYLGALDRASVPVDPNRALVLSIGRGTCRQPGQSVDESALAAHTMALFPGVRTTEQARAMIDCAAMYFC